MTWFDALYTYQTPKLTIAHITDTHLFCDKKMRYFGANTTENLINVLTELSKKEVDAVIFGGDLTQDHTGASYQVFAQLLNESTLNCPVFWVPGNHDCIEQLMNISHGQIMPNKRIQFNDAQLLLINSKSHTPAGWVSIEHLEQIKQHVQKSVLPNYVFCHHHPIPISGYVDKHILENGLQLLNVLIETEQVKALFHGHVHHDYEQYFRQLPVLATPATSIQFTKQTRTWEQQNVGAGFRLIYLDHQGYNSEVIWLNA